MKKFLKSLDLYGGNILLYHKSHRSIRTIFGGIITIIIIIIMILLIIGLSNDFFYRINPSFIKTELDPLVFPNLILNNTNFMFSLRYEDINGLTLDSTGQSFYFNIWRKHYKRNSKGEWEVLEIMPLSYSKCKRESFADHRIFDKKSIKDFYCIDYNYDKELLGGSWDSDFLNFMLVEYNICAEGHVNPHNNLSCNPSQVTDEYLSTYAFASFYIQDLFVDPSNYENPISRSIFNFYHLLDKSLFKMYDLYFIQTIVESDYGWLLQDLKQTKDIRFHSRITDYNLKSGFQDESTKYKLGTTYIYLKKSIEKYNRVYTKVQTLAANVGGMLKTFTFLMSIFIQTYNFYTFKSELVNSLASVLQPDINQIDSVKGKRVNPIIVNKRDQDMSNTLKINNDAKKIVVKKESKFNGDLIFKRE